MDAWTASVMGSPCVCEDTHYDLRTEDSFDKDRDAMVRRTTIRTRTAI